MEKESVAKRLLSLVPADREIVFICIGTDRSTGDAYGPLVGSRLKQVGVENVYGTLDSPTHAVNLVEVIEFVTRRHIGAFVIAIDASLGKFDHVGWVKVEDGPIRPGAGVKKELPEVGDISITGIVNVSGFMEYFVLQNTRLHDVMMMVDETANGILEFLQERKAVEEVAVG